MKIVLICNHHMEGMFYLEIAHLLKEKGHFPILVNVSRYSHYHTKKTGVEAYLMDDLIDMVKPYPKGESINREIAQIQEKYSTPDFEFLYRSDQGWYGRNKRKALARLILYFRAWEKFLKENTDVDYLASDVGGNYIRRSAYFIAQKMGIPMFFPYFIPLNKRMVWLDNEQYVLDNFKIIPLEETEKSEIEEMKEFRDKLLSSSIDYLYRTVSPFSLTKLQELYEATKVELLYEHFKCENYNVFRMIKYYFRHRYNRMKQHFYYNEPIEGDNYIFFPLHAWDDSQLTVRAPGFDQVEVCRKTAQEMPEGLTLYVKSHPGYEGKYPNKLFKDLSRIPRVRIISPTCHPHGLIRNAKCVLVLNSTAGFEALLFGTPAVTIAKPFFSGLGLTYDIDWPSEIGSVIEKAISTPNPATKDKVLGMMIGLKRATKEGKLSYYAGTKTNIITLKEIEDGRYTHCQQKFDVVNTLLEKIEEYKKMH
ncbi:MAG: hypothetical protein ABIH42_05010 [Planctomycetota bacterium]